MRPLVDTVPKCLVPINGRPLLDFWLELLISQGIDQVLVNTHYLVDQVEDYIENCRWKSHVKTVYENKLLGTAGSIKNNAWFFDGEEACFVAHSDNLTKFDLATFTDAFMKRQPESHLTMMTFSTETPRSCGIVELDEQGYVRVFHEKVSDPPGNHANGAIYLMDQTVLRFIAGIEKDFIDFSTEVIPHFIGRMNTYHNDVYLRDIGTPAALRRAQQDVLKGW